MCVYADAEKGEAVSRDLKKGGPHVYAWISGTSLTTSQLTREREYRAESKSALCARVCRAIYSPRAVLYFQYCINILFIIYNMRFFVILGYTK